MKNKNPGLLFFLLSALFNVIAIILFASEGGNGTGFIWLCLGSAFLCLGTSRSGKGKKEEEKQE